MFINIGNQFIRTCDIARITSTPPAVVTYIGQTFEIGVEAAKLAEEINEAEKNTSGLAMSAARISGPVSQE